MNTMFSVEKWTIYITRKQLYEKLLTTDQCLCRREYVLCLIVNLVSNKKYWYTPMNKGDKNVTLRLK